MTDETLMDLDQVLMIFTTAKSVCWPVVKESRLFSGKRWGKTSLSLKCMGFA